MCNLRRQLGSNLYSVRRRMSPRLRHFAEGAEVFARFCARSARRLSRPAVVSAASDRSAAISRLFSWHSLTSREVRILRTSASRVSTFKDARRTWACVRPRLCERLCKRYRTSACGYLKVWCICNEYEGSELKAECDYKMENAIQACRSICDSKVLMEVFRILLYAGNALNAGATRGRADVFVLDIIKDGLSWDQGETLKTAAPAQPAPGLEALARFCARLSWWRGLRGPRRGGSSGRRGVGRGVFGRIPH